MQHSTNFDVAGIPEVIRIQPIWTPWRREKRANSSGTVKESKVAYTAHTGRRAKCNDPSTWGDFDSAKAALQSGEYDGLAIAMPPGMVGADLDGCRPDKVHDEPWAVEIVARLNSYTEPSVGETGLHVLTFGVLPDGKRQFDFGDREHHGLGLYDGARGRFFCMTGKPIHGTVIAERTAELARIHAKYFPPKTKKPIPTTPVSAVSALSDAELIERARKAKNGAKFARLWAGDTTGYASASEADLALCRELAFWTAKDEGRMDALFRQSGLMRDKWEREDYRRLTMARAIQLTGEAYRGKWSPKPSVLIAADAIEPGIDTLNRMAIFYNRIEFQSFLWRGSMVVATTSTGIEILFASVADVINFARARAAIAEATAVLLAQPPRNTVSEIWDPAAQMILRLANQSAIRTEPVVKVECRDLLIQMWRYCRRPSVNNSREFMKCLEEIRMAVRDRESAPPPCVFIAEGFCWVHVPTFRNWLSLPTLTNRLYPLADIWNGLMLLGFEYVKDVTRGHAGDEESASLWRGPVDSLLE
jgi:hypothetical protein